MIHVYLMLSKRALGAVSEPDRRAPDAIGQVKTVFG
jgi:hypothetical protein